MIEYGPPTPAQAQSLDAMARRIWEETFAHGYQQADLDAYLAHAYGPTGRLIADLSNPAFEWRIAYWQGEPVGYAKLTPPWLEQADPDDLQLSQLYVARDWHGRGIAHALMDWTLATARARHAAALLLTVFENNHRAIAFYGKYGFTHIGDYDFPVGRKIDRDLIMRLAL